jgi:hypothetical protein
MSSGHVSGTQKREQYTAARKATISNLFHGRTMTGDGIGESVDVEGTDGGRAADRQHR